MSSQILLVLLGLFVVSILYSSVGHGGASGYLAVLSLSVFASNSDPWLKQQAWCLNLIVAGLAFWHYRKAGHHLIGITKPFIIASIPMAFIGGYLKIDGDVYDVMLSCTLVLAAWRLYVVNDRLNDDVIVTSPKFEMALPAGGAIGFVSGIVGVGGGIFLSPLLLLKGWATPKNAAATAAVFIWFNSAAGIAGAGYSGQLELDFSILSQFIAVVIIGGIIGSKYGAEVASQLVVKRVLVVVLVVAAARRIVGLVGI